jgi:tubulin---tyrosine ligase
VVGILTPSLTAPSLLLHRGQTHPPSTSNVFSQHSTMTQGQPTDITASPFTLSAFTSFPSSYTQNLILQALTSVIPRLSLTFEPPTNTTDIPALQWSDYDLLNLDTIQANPTTQLISSYVYRKTLIRKQNVHHAIAEYLAKQRYRGNVSVLENGVPKGWTIDIQMADELDELLMDELYDLREALTENLEKEEKDRRCV